MLDTRRHRKLIRLVEGALIDIGRGESGCGKSTLSRAIMRLAPVASDHRDICRAPRHPYTRTPLAAFPGRELAAEAA